MFNIYLLRDHVDPIAVVDADRILGSIKASICTLALCPSSLLKLFKDHIYEPLMSIINQ